jgi:hypothetical protein
LAQLNSISSVESIVIHNGSFTAIGVNGPGIGSGYGFTESNATVGDIFVSDGTFTAIGSRGAGIGSGYGRNGGISHLRFLSISNGNFTAIGNDGGSGIGSGIGNASSFSSVDTISITGGHLTAIGNNGAGIGSGWDNSTVGNLTISDGTFQLSSNSGPGIGGITNTKLLGGCFVIDNGSVGVGNTSSLRIGSVDIDCRSIGDKTCLEGTSIVFEGGSVTAVTGALNLIEFGTIAFSGFTELYTRYTGPSTQERFTGLAVIHIESVSFPCDLIYEVTVEDDNYKRVLLMNSSTFRGFGVSVPSAGDYILNYESAEKLSFTLSSGFLYHGNSTTFAAISGRDAFYSDVRLNDDTTNCWSRGTEEFTLAVGHWYMYRRKYVSLSKFVLMGFAF